MNELANRLDHIIGVAFVVAIFALLLAALYCLAMMLRGKPVPRILGGAGKNW